MKNFLKPTIFKVILTIILIIAAFGGELFYDRNITLDTNGNIIEPNLIIRGIGLIASVINFPMRFIINSIAKPFGPEIYTTPLTLLLLELAMLTILIIETYLISCIVNLLFNRKQ